MVYDLTDIDPHRRADILRRIEAIERFNLKPGRATAEAEAKSIGMSPSAFYGLVKAWNFRRDASKLPGARLGRRGPGIEPEAAELIASIVTENPALRPADVIFRVKQRASMRGVALPTDQTIGTQVRRLRKGTVLNMPDVSHFLDRCLWDVPIETDDGKITRAVLTLLIDSTAATPVGIHLGINEPGSHAAAAALGDAIGRGALKEGHGVLIDREEDKSWLAVEAALRAIGIDPHGTVEPVGTCDRDAGAFRRRGNGRSILAALGRFVAGYPIKVMTARAMNRPVREVPAMSLEAAGNLLHERTLPKIANVAKCSLILNSFDDALAVAHRGGNC